MHEHEIRGWHNKLRFKATTDSKHDLPVASKMQVLGERASSNPPAQEAEGVRLSRDRVCRWFPGRLQLIG
jgi:hypothetical protein